MKALLLSGGIDSTAVAYWLRPSVAVTIDYGQLAAEAEIHAAKCVTEALDIPHRIVKVDCRHLGSGCMVDGQQAVHAKVPEWWPYRNQLLVTIGAMSLANDPVKEIWLGTVKGDRTHRDGRKAFVRSLDKLMGVQEGGVRVKAPAITMTAEELLHTSGLPADLLGWTFSCHVSPYACGQCRGCAKHAELMLDHNDGFPALTKGRKTAAT